MAALRQKYDPVIGLGQEFNVRDLSVQESNNKLEIRGTTQTQYEKDKLWDEIKRIGGENPTDLMADIKVATSDYYHKHTVQKGESLSLIAKHYYKDPMEYKRIHQANSDTIKDPNMIYPGQEILIPYPEGRGPGR